MDWQNDRSVCRGEKMGFQFWLSRREWKVGEQCTNHSNLRGLWWWGKRPDTLSTGSLSTSGRCSCPWVLTTCARSRLVSCLDRIRHLPTPWARTVCRANSSRLVCKWPGYTAALKAEVGHQRICSKIYRSSESRGRTALKAEVGHQRICSKIYRSSESRGRTALKVEVGHQRIC